MIAFLFLYRGLDAIPRFAFHADRIRDRGVPFSRFVMACGIATMITGGLLVLVDFFYCMLKKKIKRQYLKN